MSKRIPIFLLVIALLGTVLSGCGDGSTAVGSHQQEPQSSGSAGTVQQGGEITVAIAQDLDDSLDPHLVVKAGTREILFNVFEGLLKPLPNGDLTLAVAESFKVSDDGITYTFTLRDGVQFHNGETVTADDVVYSIERCADTSGGQTPLVEAFSNIQSVAAPDAGTVVIKLKSPDGEFLSYLTTAILPRNYDRQDTAPVGTGPFKFVSRTAQDSIVLEKFDGYWGTPAYLNRVTFKIIENADALVLALQSGSVDLCPHLTATQASQLSGDYQVLEGTMNLVQALYLNNAAAPFDNEKVRQALCWAVDKQAVIDLAFDGHGEAVGSSMYPAFGKYFDDSLTDYYTCNPQKAKALLAEAGYPDGFDMTITVPSNYQPHVDTAQVLVEQLEAVGVRAQIQTVDWNTWVSDVYTNRDFQSTVVGVDASTMTARALLERFTSSYGKNFINYSDPEYDALFSRALAETDDARRTELYKQMEQNLAKHAANVYLQAPGDFVAIRSNLAGYTFYPIYVQDLSRVYYTA